jgi:predicted esterase
MTSKNWPSGFAGVCGTSCRSGIPPAKCRPYIAHVCAISLFCLAAGAQQKAPAIALMDGADALQWQNWTRELGWQVIAADGAPDKNIDLRVLALAAKVEAAIKSGTVDASRVYLAGRGEGATAVFYAIARMPDLWAAAAALGGSPKPAIDTGRVFAVNFTNVPVLWISGDDGKAMADKLAAAKIKVEWRTASSGASAASVFEWLAQHKRDEFPASIDCETLSPQFARCYWIQMTRFDPLERNDVLASTRMIGGSGAALELGGFGWKLDDPGPGILVSFLPEKYSGPLKMNDRIIALDGKPIADAKQFQDILDKVTDEGHTVATVQRGKDRIRVETRFTVPRRDATVSARVQAEYLPAEKTIQIISRTITEMRVTVPPHWTLAMQKEILHAERCK